MAGVRVVGTEDSAVEAGTFVGTVLEPLPNALFRVALENGHKILAHGAAGVRQSHLRLLPGDRVRIEVTQSDPTRGRIVERLK